MLDSSGNLESATGLPGTNDADTKAKMGATYRTPSPAMEEYQSSNHEKSPQGQRQSSLDLIDPLSHGPAAPQTPAPKRNWQCWNGLPSPQTPSFGAASSGAGSTASFTREQVELSSETSDELHETQAFTSTQSTSSELQSRQQTQTVSSALLEEVTVLKDENVEDKNCDAELAHELEATLSSLRRSSRISTKSKVEDAHQPAVPPTQKVPRAVAVQPSAQPETAITPFKADPVPFEGLPAPNTLDWELQYPPGGSSHPSYPYPSLDPRLVFSEQFVPMKDGLPDISQVPKLVLPIGWRHVSWSGLIPIAFDPYQQAFKLTPVGPMPLTCEELHQNGLHKYVPGGEMHPETTYLPEMMKLSDGSDGVVYDWDGVDWVLPWVETGGFDALPVSSMGLSPGVVSGTTSQDISSASLVVDVPWREARDCPNMIFDLSDAWTWLADKEQRPDADFVPSPNKQWRGAGAYRSYRKLKDPIPQLMMLAIQSTLTSPNENPYSILQNQDARDVQKSDAQTNMFCAFKSVATPMNVDITLLADTEFTIKELLCYFPQHFSWGHAAERFSRAGITPSPIRDMINMTRGLVGEAALKISTISSAMTTGKRRDLFKNEETGAGEEADTSLKPTNNGLTTTYTAEGWYHDAGEKIDYPLLALAHGLQDLPSGPDAGPLTTLIHWCRENGRYKVFISDVPALLKEAGIEPLFEPTDEDCPDKDVMRRHAESLKIDHKRVRETLTEKKRTVENGDEGKQKRRRMD